MLKETSSYTPADEALDRKIEALEAQLVKLYAKRANKHVTHDWWWCPSGRHKAMRYAPPAVYDPCGCVACPWCKAPRAPNAIYEYPVENRVRHRDCETCHACGKLYAWTDRGVVREACADCGEPAVTRRLADVVLVPLVPCCADHI